MAHTKVQNKILMTPCCRMKNVLAFQFVVLRNVSHCSLCKTLDHKRSWTYMSYISLEWCQQLTITFWLLVYWERHIFKFPHIPCILVHFYRFKSYFKNIFHTKYYAIVNIRPLIVAMVNLSIPSLGCNILRDSVLFVQM